MNNGINLLVNIYFITQINSLPVIAWQYLYVTFQKRLGFFNLISMINIRYILVRGTNCLTI